MAEERKVARLDLSSFKPKTAPTVDPTQDRAAVAEGKRLGFTGRGEAEKIDGLYAPSQRQDADEHEGQPWRSARFQAGGG